MDREKEKSVREVIAKYARIVDLCAIIVLILMALRAGAGTTQVYEGFTQTIVDPTRIQHSIAIALCAVALAILYGHLPKRP